jgi:outer membrane protein TolC
MIRKISTVIAPLCLATIILPGASASAFAQTAQAAQTLSLDDALRRAIDQSENIGIARAGVMRADGRTMGARSQFLPQIFASAGYTKTLKSQFEAFTSGGNGSFEGLEDLPFGQENQWSVGVQVSQALYSGGRMSASVDVAQSGRRSADILLASHVAQLTVDVTTAYYDAVLADLLAGIADSALAQTEAALRQTELSRTVGGKSEFELLRARVTRDNQRPVVIQRHADRELAYLRLRQLVGAPFDTPIALSTQIPDVGVATGALPPGADTSTAARSTVRLAAEAVAASEGTLRMQQSERMPAVRLSSEYGRVGYPSSLFPGWNDFLENFTVGIALQLPVFTGGRLRGATLSSRADVDEARQRLRQTEELAALDARSAVASLREAEEAWRASLGTVEQAQRAYEIAEVRFREGLSTQLELTEARVLLQTARANRAAASRNLQVSQVRLRVLKDLPVAGSISGR